LEIVQPFLTKERTMSVDESEHTTSIPHPTTESPQKMVQEAFHHHLREQIRDAVKIVMEEIMREELTQFLGAQWGEASEDAQRIPQWELYSRLVNVQWEDRGSSSSQGSRRTVPYPAL
jgi:hypothetical protein